MTEERRHPDHLPDDEFSPEYLAMLVVCGGTVRDSDWAVLPESLAERRVPAGTTGSTATTGAQARHASRSSPRG